MSNPDHDLLKKQLLDAALPHVAFDGWTEATFREAIADSDITEDIARATCPRGALDLAVAFHKEGDQMMRAAIEATPMDTLRYSEKIAACVRLRLEAVQDKEAVRRGTTLFALPHNAADGARLIWETCDLIWDAMGDTSEDVNWYTKRATLSGVYASTVLYWLGDDSLEYHATWDFLDRRIENVMQIEKLKGQLRANPLLSQLLSGPNWALSHVKKPAKTQDSNLPGRWGQP